MTKKIRGNQREIVVKVKRDIKRNNKEKKEGEVGQDQMIENIKVGRTKVHQRKVNEDIVEVVQVHQVLAQALDEILIILINY